MSNAKKVNRAAAPEATAEELLRKWEQEFRADFARDSGARFETLILRFGIQTSAQEMLEGTVDFVTACAAFSSMDGAEISTLLVDQRYDGQASAATYALTFDLFGRSAARLLVRPEMKSIDLADLFEYPWDRLRVAGYREIWVSRLDGDELSLEEIDELDRVVSADIWFDSGEDDVSIIFDPDTYAGALAITVYEQTEDTPGTAATEA
jgi:hypothetical protein